MHTVLLKDFYFFILMPHLVGKLTKKKGSAGKMKVEVPGKGQKKTHRKKELKSVRLKQSRNSTSCLKNFSERKLLL